MNTTQALDRLLDPVGRSFGVKTAQAIANLRPTPICRRR